MIKNIEVIKPDNEVIKPNNEVIKPDNEVINSLLNNKIPILKKENTFVFGDSHSRCFNSILPNNVYLNKFYIYQFLLNWIFDL